MAATSFLYGGRNGCTPTAPFFDPLSTIHPYHAIQNILLWERSALTGGAFSHTRETSENAGKKWCTKIDT